MINESLVVALKIGRPFVNIYMYKPREKATEVIRFHLISRCTGGTHFKVITILDFEIRRGVKRLSCDLLCIIYRENIYTRRFKIKIFEEKHVAYMIELRGGKNECNVSNIYRDHFDRCYFTLC